MNLQSLLHTAVELTVKFQHQYKYQNQNQEVRRDSVLSHLCCTEVSLFVISVRLFVRTMHSQNRGVERFD